jgi:hypothetical protein
VAAQVFLDRAELGRQQPGTGEDERLDDAGDPAVSVGERMHGDDVQVGHGGAYRHVSSGVSVL